MVTKEELLRRAGRYGQRVGLVLREQLGVGLHGIVFLAESETKPGRSAVKVHEREVHYCRERDVYLRLQLHAVTEIHGSHVPQLLRYDDQLWVIEMEVVTRPYVLDFAGAYLDRPPDYPDDVLAEWRSKQQEQFGHRWHDVEIILWSLEGYGIFLVDVSVHNVAFDD